MSFRIGQRVRSIASLNQHAVKWIGAVGTICGPVEMLFTSVGQLAHQNVAWEEGAGPWTGRVGLEPIKCLAPIDEPSQFERFMERVLKPVLLPQEIEA